METSPSLNAPQAAIMKTLLNQRCLAPLVAQAFSVPTSVVAHVQSGKIFGEAPPAPDGVASAFLASRGLI